MWRWIAAALCACTLLPALADQTVIPSYSSARDTYFYPKLYPDGGTTIYCEASFADRSGLNVEHVYPASWMKPAAGCPERFSRQRCRDHSERFNRMEADLHNLWPTLAEVNRDRLNCAFGIVGEDDDAETYAHPRAPEDDCDFEVNPEDGVVEPRAASRGEIALDLLHA